MKNIIDRIPFREGSASRKLILAVAKAKRPVSAVEAAKAAKLPLAKAQTLLAAYRNKFHSATMRRSGLNLVLADHKFSLRLAKIEPKAKRPARGKKAKKQNKKKSRSKNKKTLDALVPPQPASQDQTPASHA